MDKSNTQCIIDRMTKTISIRIDEELLHAVDIVGEKEKRGRSEVIREALETWLKQRTIEEKVQRHRAGYLRQPVTDEEFSPVLGAQTWPK